MKMDEALCLCFQVTKRKVINYIRVNRPQKASQLSQCFGAGTGCGWCRPFLTRLMQQAQDGVGVFDEQDSNGGADDERPDDLPDLATYAAARQRHRQ